jgi:hypothetical protein
MQLTKQWLANDAADSPKVRLLNNTALRFNNLAGTAIDVFKYNASDVFQCLIPMDMNAQVISNLADPVNNQDAATKSWVVGLIPAAGANTTLSNLTSPTAINQDLIFGKATPILKSADVATGTSEILLLQSGNGTAANAASGNLNVKSGNAFGSGVSGDVSIVVGAVDTGTRGKIVLDGSYVDTSMTNYLWTKNIYPAVDGSYRSGAGGNEWMDVATRQVTRNAAGNLALSVVSGLLTLGGASGNRSDYDLFPNLNSINLGRSATGNHWANVYAHALTRNSAGALTLSTTAGNIALIPVGGNVNVTGNILPEATGTRALGDSGYAWNFVYSNFNLVYQNTTYYNGATPRGVIRAIDTGTPAAWTANFVIRNPAIGVTNGNTLGIWTANDALADANASGDVYIESGNKTAGTGNSGSIRIQTGSSVGGVRGSVVINALNVDMSSKKIISLADPTNAQDAATKNYVDQSVLGALIYQGTFDPTGPTPNFIAIAGKKGWFYKVIAAGTAYGKTWAIGDDLILNSDFAIGAFTNAMVDQIDNTEGADILRNTMLASTQIFVGNSSGIATPVSMSGQATMSDTGVVTLSAGINKTNKKDVLTYDGLTPTYTYDLSYVAANDSILVMVDGGPIALEGAGLDYTVSYTGGAGGVTRITLLSRFYSNLINGDKIYVKYQY